MKKKKTEVVIVGAGLAGLATAACLTMHAIPHVILEREDCIASLWHKKSYDCLHLHLAKQFCQLPHLPHPPSCPTFMSKNHFITYINDYVACFNLCPHLRCEVESAIFDDEEGKWQVVARNLEAGEVEEYVARFVVVATGENDKAVVPEFPGIESSPGEVIHSMDYRNGSKYKGKDVLVVGCGNSGMEIALDLSNFGAKAAIVVRNELHVVPKELLFWIMLLRKFLPIYLLDAILLFLCYFKYGDTAKYGIQRPKQGPLHLKETTPIYPVIDVGTFQKIKSGHIQVLPSVKSIKGNNVRFKNEISHQFDAIILATGYKSSAKEWLKGDDYLIGEDGISKQKFPNHWKGRHGLYCAGLARKGIYGLANDAENIANDINTLLKDDDAKKMN
ncbi:Indole-3-pyruvate monooxygenase protein [Dioscorea alata]|uniref:Indole-3-pyruvate monooxygenase protein n=1 Tax=Dioscorea alata TaxID=55571 RepID=A0ACB7UDG6_DIOAL|nr:Indole-3-pyruvate monooxygenase protein [Dioscorea alata]